MDGCVKEHKPKPFRGQVSNWMRPDDPFRMRDGVHQANAGDKWTWTNQEWADNEVTESAAWKRLRKLNIPDMYVRKDSGWIALAKRI